MVSPASQDVYNLGCSRASLRFLLRALFEQVSGDWMGVLRQLQTLAILQI